MRSLFWKLFGAFWLTTVAILAVTIFLSFQLAGKSRDSFIDPREVEIILQDVLQTSGIEGLEEYISNPANFSSGRTVYLVDENGKELLNRVVPERHAAKARRVWNVRARRDGNRRNGPRRIRQNLLETPDGRLLLAMPGPMPPARFGILSSSNIRWTVLTLAAVISLLSFWLLSRSLTRPVARISATAGRLADGDMAARVGSAGYTGDEIGELAEQFDRMAAELDSQSKTRRELFRNIAHELRAPLTRLQIATELLERQPERSEDHLGRIRYEIDRVENLTRQVLSLARAEQVQNTLEVTSLTEVLRQVVADAEFEASARAVTLVYQEPDSEIEVRGNSAAISSAIENVLRNAVQITPADSEVTIELSENPAYTVTVDDHGPGVAENKLEKIFEPFYRMDTNRPGAGIGLAITRRVVQQLGGDLRATNRSTGGLRVTMRFPPSMGS